MKIRTLALVLGAAATMAVGGLAATACSSSSSGNGGGGGGNDSGAGNDSTAGGDTGTSGDDSSAGGDTGSGGEAGPDCGSTPSLHSDEAGTIYCGFADAGSLSCPLGQECCIGGSLGGGNFGVDDCEPWGQGCTNPADGGLSVQCEQTSDCTANGHAGSVCCIKGTTPAAVPGCGYDKAKGGTGVFCEQGTACASGDIQICSSQADCPTGTTCTPFKWKIIQLGYCK